MRVSVVPHPGQSLKFLHVLLGVWCYLIVVSISIFLRTNDAELLFMCLLTICIFSLLQRLFKSLVHFLGGTIVLLLSFESTLFWVPVFYQICDELIFSPSSWFVFHSFNTSTILFWLSQPYDNSWNQIGLVTCVVMLMVCNAYF